ncbi:MAG TPA: tetratricopeptide repeat-containing protein [Acetobacteraceae bacterium]|jgi:tetratricopeptide (TPR) repeat protein|nr:tetratricopeptide repeat-containing protein [Acetobacteraceae bacterium]
MFQDCRGLPLTTVSQKAAAAFDHAIDGYLGYRADMMLRMQALLAADPDFGLAHTLKGYLFLMGFRADLLGAARAALADARRCPGTERERAHTAALAHWIEGDPEAAIAVWDQILTDHPHDLLAFRLAHFLNFWCGRPEAMLASVLSVERHWSPALPAYGSILACRCFAHEESGYYLEAEHAGREAVRRDPTDLWAAHGVAHVLEMTGRRLEGIAWVERLQARWDGTNNLKHHLWWHQAMYHLELGDFAKVLSLYDSGFRDLASPLTEGAPDLYIDVQNAASMLFRLGRHGVDVGDRWTEIADKAQARIGDCQSAFTLPHWMMALAATGRESAANDMLAGMRDFAVGGQPIAGLVRNIALPVTEAVLANGQGRHADAVALMRPVIGEMYLMGGSHAQQDVLEQVFMDSALKAGSAVDARMMLQRAAGRHPVPPARRRGYAMGAQLLAG